MERSVSSYSQKEPCPGGDTALSFGSAGLFLDQRDRPLDEIREILAFQHAVREQGQVDDLLDEAVFAADLAQTLVALVAQGDDLLRQFLAGRLLLGSQLLFLSCPSRPHRNASPRPRRRRSFLVTVRSLSP